MERAALVELTPLQRSSSQKCDDILTTLTLAVARAETLSIYSKLSQPRVAMVVPLPKGIISKTNQRFLIMRQE